jgi:putative ABC transport system permease protein
LNELNNQDTIKKNSDNPNVDAFTTPISTEVLIDLPAKEREVLSKKDNK